MNVKHKLMLLAGAGLASALAISGVSFFNHGRWRRNAPSRPR